MEWFGCTNENQSMVAGGTFEDQQSHIAANDIVFSFFTDARIFDPPKFL